jgi:hypothetical protein
MSKFIPYDQQHHNLQQAIIHANMSAQKEEMELNEKPLFSKKEIERIREKIPYYFLFGIGIAFILAFIVCKFI